MNPLLSLIPESELPPVLVTGGAGYIGSHMVLDLMKTGEEIVVLDDFSTGFPGLVPAGVRVVEGDIGNRKLLERLIPDYRIDAIAHFPTGEAKSALTEAVEFAIARAY